MANTLLVILTAVSGITMLLACIALFRVRQAFRRAQDQIRDFLISPDEKTPSHLAQYADLIAQVFATRLVSSLQAAVRGAAGGAARAENEAALSDAAAGSPILAAAQVFAPSLVKKLGKNPVALMALSALGNKLTGVKAGSVPATGDNGNKPRMNLAL